MKTRARLSVVHAQQEVVGGVEVSPRAMAPAIRRERPGSPVIDELEMLRNALEHNYRRLDRVLEQQSKKG